MPFVRGGLQRKRRCSGKTSFFVRHKSRADVRFDVQISLILRFQVRAPPRLFCSVRVAASGAVLASRSRHALARRWRAFRFRMPEAPQRALLDRRTLWETCGRSQQMVVAAVSCSLGCMDSPGVLQSPLCLGDTLPVCVWCPRRALALASRWHRMWGSFRVANATEDTWS